MNFCPMDFHSLNPLLIQIFVQLHKAALLLNVQSLFHLLHDLIRQLHQNRIKHFRDINLHIKDLVPKHKVKDLKLHGATLVPILNKFFLRFPVLKKLAHLIKLVIF
jgi:hypothetical protein